MRPLELIIGGLILVHLVDWVAGRRVSKVLPLVLAALVVAHLALEGPRAMMALAYLYAALLLIARLRRPADQPVVRRRPLVLAGRTLGALLIAGVTLGPALLWPVMRLPAPKGPYRVGTTWLVVTDSSRTERFGPDRSVRRRLPVKAWYPAAGAGGRPAAYATAAEVNVANRLPGFLLSQFRHVKTHSFDGAPIADSGGRFPTLVFSHGYTGFAAQNTPQMEELASRGYIVFSIVHPYEASAAPFPDGPAILLEPDVLKRLFPADPKAAAAKVAPALARIDSAKSREGRLAALRAFLDLSPEPLRTESVGQWAADTKAVIDHLDRLDQGGGAPFQGRLNLEQLGVFGMSYGGATVGEFCRKDARCRAGINIDGGQYGGLIDDSLTVPYLIVASETAYPVHVPVLDVSRGPSYLVRVPATQHLGLTDYPLFAPNLFQWLGMTGTMNPYRREAIMTAYVLGFFDTYLKGERSPLFDGPSRDFPEVVFQARNAQ